MTILIWLFFWAYDYSKYDYFLRWQYDFYCLYEKNINMTICNMTIFSKISKYDYLQYEYFFKNLVIFRLKNMTKKKTYGSYTVLILNPLSSTYLIG